MFFYNFSLPDTHTGSLSGYKTKYKTNVLTFMLWLMTAGESWCAQVFFKELSQLLSTHGQKFATGSWFDPDPRTRIHSCRRLRRLRGRRHARTASFHHVHGQSRKRNQEFLFQGVDLEVTFLESFFHLTLYEQPHFFVCLRRLCLRRSPGVTQVLRLSLSLSHTHSPSSKSDPGRLYVSFRLVCLEKSQNQEALSNPSTNNSVIESTTSSAHWRSTHRHAWQSAKTPTDPRKVFPGKQTSKILAFLEKEVYFWDSWRLPWAG